MVKFDRHRYDTTAATCRVQEEQLSVDQLDNRTIHDGGFLHMIVSSMQD
jgi:hypothetical protein